MSRNRTGKGRYITKAECVRALDLRAMGYTWTRIGRVLERTPHSISKAVREGFYEEHEQALEQFRDRIRDERIERAFAQGRWEKDKWSAMFLQELAKEQLPETQAAMAQKQKVELSGVDGGPIEIEGGHHVTSLNDVLALARQIGVSVGAGGNDRPALPAVSGAGEVLPDHQESAGAEPAAEPVSAA